MSFNSVMEAQLYKALLESAGIPARMQNDIAAQVMPAYGALMQVNLLVAEEDQKKAREVLGAKFDIDEFHRESNGPDLNPARKKAPAKRTAAKTGEGTKKPAAKKESAPKKETAKAPAAKKPAAKKAPAKKPATEE